jgi:hypothetical protein
MGLLFFLFSRAFEGLNGGFREDGQTDGFLGNIGGCLARPVLDRAKALPNLSPLTRWIGESVGLYAVTESFGRADY